MCNTHDFGIYIAFEPETIEAYILKCSRLRHLRALYVIINLYKKKQSLYTNIGEQR